MTDRDLVAAVLATIAALWLGTGAVAHLEAGYPLGFLFAAAAVLVLVFGPTPDQVKARRRSQPPKYFQARPRGRVR